MVQQFLAHMDEVRTVDVTITGTYRLKRHEADCSWGVDPTDPDWADLCVAHDRRELLPDGGCDPLQVLSWLDSKPTVRIELRPA